jgi:large subunit ribosomal protein L29
MTELIKIEEIREKSVDELKKLVIDSKRELFNLRFQKAGGELQNTSRFSAVRKQVARLKTALQEKASGKSPVVKSEKSGVKAKASKKQASGKSK